MSGELDFSSRLSAFSCSCFTDSLTIGPKPRKAEVLRGIAFVRRPVKPAGVETLGVLTTNEESDFSFLLRGNVTASGASTFLLLKGNIFDLISCRL